jgi:ABC-type uncharacterized transport system ATPase subunit
MNLLTVENLTKSFGEKLLFENISFGIEVVVVREFVALGYYKIKGYI